MQKKAKLLSRGDVRVRFDTEEENKGFYNKKIFLWN